MMDMKTGRSPLAAKTQNPKKAHVKRLIRLPEVMAQVGLGRSSIYGRIAEGSFPRPIPIGANSVAWDQDAVQAWVRERIEAGGCQ